MIKCDDCPATITRHIAQAELLNEYEKPDE